MSANVLGGELQAAIAECRRVLASQRDACTAGDSARVLGLATEADWSIARIEELAARLGSDATNGTTLLTDCRRNALSLHADIAATMTAAVQMRDGIVREISHLAREQQGAGTIGYRGGTVKVLSVLDTTG